MRYYVILYISVKSVTLSLSKEPQIFKSHFALSYLRHYTPPPRYSIQITNPLSAFQSP